MTKAVKKIARYIVNTCSILIVVISVVLMISVIFTQSGNIPNVMGYSMLRVLTGSMDPEIPTNSLIIVKQSSVSELKEGDVISFYSMDPELDGMVNTHRVTRIVQEYDGEKIYTKGDANGMEDEYPTDAEHLVGKVVWSSEIIGTVVRLVSNPLVFVPIIVAPLLLILIYHIRQVVHTTKEISSEQEDAYKEALEKIVKNKQERKKLEEEQKASLQERTSEEISEKTSVETPEGGEEIHGTDAADSTERTDKANNTDSTGTDTDL